MAKKPQKRTSAEKVEIAKHIANQGQRVANTYAAVETSVLRIIRWMSAWIDKLLFNPKFGKPVSLILAILLYSTINYGGDGFFTPGVSSSGDTISNIPLTVIANNEVYEVAGLPSTVNASLVGEMADIAMIKNQGGYKVVADLTGLTEGTHQVNLVPVDFSPRVNVAINPSTAVVTIRRKVSQKFILDYDFVNVNKMDLEYVLSEPQLELTEIIVRAAENTIQSIAFVKAFIDVEGVTETFTKEVPIVAYDQMGNRVNVDIVPSVVKATVRVTNPSKVVPIVVETVGEIPNGMAISSITMDHNSVTLFAPESVLATIEELRVPINATTLTSDTNLVYTVTLPSGVRKSSVTKINMDIKLEQGASRVFEQVPVDYRFNTSGYRFTLVDPDDTYLDIEVFGTESEISQLTLDDFVVYIDLKDIELGRQSVNVFVDAGRTFLKFTPEKTSIEIDVIR